MTSAISLPFIGNVMCDDSSGQDNGKRAAGALLSDTSAATANAKVDVLLKNGLIFDVRTGSFISDKIILTVS
jgi:hypothetical protein